MGRKPKPLDPGGIRHWEPVPGISTVEQSDLSAVREAARAALQGRKAALTATLEAHGLVELLTALDPKAIAVADNRLFQAEGIHIDALIPFVQASGGSAWSVRHLIEQLIHFANDKAISPQEFDRDARQIVNAIKASPAREAHKVESRKPSVVGSQLKAKDRDYGDPDWL